MRCLKKRQFEVGLDRLGWKYSVLQTRLSSLSEYSLLAVFDECCHEWLDEQML